MIKIIETIRWEKGKVVLVDQTKLPRKLTYVECGSLECIEKSIKDMVVRGAPAIGVTAALGLALVAQNCISDDPDKVRISLRKAANILRDTRPTAVNLFWAIDEVLKAAEDGKTAAEVRELVLKKALEIREKDVETNRLIGIHGEKLVGDDENILTHCNAGSLATVKYGTALAPLYIAKEKGKRFHVYADETRPRLQGAKLTAWELTRAGIPVTVITDNTAGFLMQLGKVDKIFVGADRILRDGTTYNKIGTYSLAVLAKHHGIPFYVFAPTSTIDLKTPMDKVIIEERSPEEVYMIDGVQIAPKNAEFINLAFDRTPPELISGIVTEKGIIYPPFKEGITKLFK